MKLNAKQRAGRKGGLKGGRKGGRSHSAAKRAAVRANGAKGGRPRKDGRPPIARVIERAAISAAGTDYTIGASADLSPETRGPLAPLWQRLDAFLRANGPSTLRTLQFVAIDLAERRRVVEALRDHPELFREPPAPATRWALRTRSAPLPTALPPLWRRIEAFLRANGPTTLRSLRSVAVDLPERERVRQELQRRPHLFHITPGETFGGDLWTINDRP